MYRPELEAGGYTRRSDLQARWAVLRIDEDRTVERGLLLRLQEREASGVHIDTKFTQRLEDAYVFDPAPPPGYTSSSSSSDSRFGGSLP